MVVNIGIWWSRQASRICLPSTGVEGQVQQGRGSIHREDFPKSSTDKPVVEAELTRFDQVLADSLKKTMEAQGCQRVAIPIQDTHHESRTFVFIGQSGSLSPMAEFNFIVPPRS